VCLYVRQDISRTKHAIFNKFLCLLPMSVARSFCMLTIGRIAYRREEGDGSAQRGRSVIYDCLVNICSAVAITGYVISLMFLYFLLYCIYLPQYCYPTTTITVYMCNFVKIYLFRHQRKRAQANYMTVESMTMSIYMLDNETRLHNCTIGRRNDSCTMILSNYKI